jgi:hypothetical protein
MFSIASLPMLLQLAQTVQATVAAVVAGFRAGHPDLQAKNPDGTYVVTDEAIVAKAVSDTTTGIASADALIDRLRAGS